MLEGSNIVVLDLETLKSADACRYCGKSEADHFPRGSEMLLCYLNLRDSASPSVDWNNTSLPRLSTGYMWDYQDGQMHGFDRWTLETTMARLVDRQPLLVSFNGRRYDFPLMIGLLRQEAESLLRSDTELARRHAQALHETCDAFHILSAASYDLLHAISQADPLREFERGLNSLWAISVANGYATPATDSSGTPRLWAEERYAKALTYYAGDVDMTRLLFEQILRTGSIRRGDNQPLRLSVPEGWVRRYGVSRKGDTDESGV